MKSIVLIIGLCLLFFSPAKAQKNYAEAIRQGDAARDQGQYETAMNKYFAAEAFDPTKKNEVKEKISALFILINNLKTKAEKAQAEAEKQTNIVRAHDLMEKATTVLTDDPTLALRLAEASMKLASLPENTAFAEKIYKEHNFYKVVGRKSDRVAAAVFSPDGKMILVGNLDNTACLWGIDGKLIREFKGHTGAVEAVAFSADGKMILTGSADKTTRVWKVDGTMLYELKGHTDSVTAVAFSPDIKTIVTADSIVRFWKIDGTKIHEIKFEYPSKIASIEFSPDGSRILIKVGGYMELYSADGKQYFGAIVDGNRRRITFAAFSIQGKYIVGYSESGLLWWDYQNKQIRKPFDFDGRLLLSGNINGTIRNEYGTVVLVGHKGRIKSVAVSPDGKNILSVSDDLTARIWQLDRKYTTDYNSSVNIKLPDNRQSTTYKKSFLTDQHILVSGLDGKVISESIKRADEISPPVFSADGKTVVTGSIENILGSKGVDEKMITVFKRQRNLVTTAAFSPDGKKMLTAAFDSAAYLWGADGEMIREFKHSSMIKSVAFSPDGKTILTGSLNGIASLWALDGTMLQEFKIPGKKNFLQKSAPAAIDFVTFSPEWLLRNLFIGYFQVLIFGFNPITGYSSY